MDNKKKVQKQPKTKKIKSKKEKVFNPAKYNIVPILMFFISLLIEVGLVFEQNAGIAGIYISLVLKGVMGIASYFLPVICILISFLFFKWQKSHILTYKFIFAFVTLLFLSTISSLYFAKDLLSGEFTISQIFELGVQSGGGVIGIYLSIFMMFIFGDFISYIVSTFVFLISLSLFLGYTRLGLWFNIFSFSLPKKKEKVEIREETIVEKKPEVDNTYIPTLEESKQSPLVNPTLNIDLREDSEKTSDIYENSQGGLVDPNAGYVKVDDGMSNVNLDNAQNTLNSQSKSILSTEENEKLQKAMQNGNAYSPFVNPFSRKPESKNVQSSSNRQKTQNNGNQIKGGVSPFSNPLAFLSIFDKKDANKGNQAALNSAQNPNNAYGNNGYQNGSYPNGSYPNGSYPNGSYPNSGYQNGNYPNNGYPNNGYSNGAYQNNGYVNNQGYNGYANSGYNTPNNAMPVNQNYNGANANNYLGNQAAINPNQNLYANQNQNAYVGQNTNAYPNAYEQSNIPNNLNPVNSSSGYNSYGVSNNGPQSQTNPKVNPNYSEQKVNSVYKNVSQNPSYNTSETVKVNNLSNSFNSNSSMQNKIILHDDEDIYEDEDNAEDNIDEDNDENIDDEEYAEEIIEEQDSYVEEDPYVPGVGEERVSNNYSQGGSRVSFGSYGYDGRNEKTGDDGSIYEKKVAFKYELNYPNYVYPSLNLLHEVEKRNVIPEEEILEIKNRLLNKLASFRIEASLASYSVGPRITRYEILPGPGVKVKSITSLTEDIGLELESDGVRIGAVPGKNTIGIEVPNRKDRISKVSLRELLQNPEFVNAKSKLTCAVGETVTGKAVYMDIDDMPHVLIAGETKSGKSVSINCIILSLIYRASPDEVKLLLIDPKRVELNVYSKIPHLIMPVIDIPQKAAAALHWAVDEMERRYQLMDQLGVRNRDEYNELRKTKPKLEILPQIVIIIDELADLMLQVREHVEEHINRIAAKARACGMHLVVGTQRPSVDIVTGLIKANIPARISFKVASSQDSKTILTTVGAEKLLGKGDMLYQATGSGRVRLQGALVEGSEIKEITRELIENNGEADFDQDILYQLDNETENIFKSKKGGNQSSQNEPRNDEVIPDTASISFELLCAGIEYSIKNGSVATNNIQRYFHLGFNRAADLMDKMEELGFIGPRNGSKPRDVLVNFDTYQEWKLNHTK